MNEKISEAWESATVWWFMRDPQEKQVILVAALSIFMAVLELATTVQRAKIEGSNRGN